MVVLFSKRTYQITWVLLVVAIAGTFFHRAAYFDEAWFAEQSYWLIQTGKVRSELFRGYNGWENGIYVFHKLFIYAGAFVMSLTGFTVASSKLVSIGFGLAGGYLVWLYGKQSSDEQRWLTLLLYFGCGTLIRFISVNRPETMCMALGFASYVALESPGKVRPKPMLAGMWAGLAALTHLNGLIYLVAGGIWLFVRAGWKVSGLYAVAGGLILSLYSLDALLDNHVGQLIDQFVNDPATQGNLEAGGKLTVLADYHQIFFHSQNEAALTVLVLLCAIAFRKKIRLSQPLLRYTLLLLVSFWLLTKSDTDIYFILFLPWFAILVANWVVTNLPGQPAWQRKVGQILLFGYGLVAVEQLRFVLIENQTAPNLEEYNSLLASHMPRKKTKVIAPIGFFFGQVDRYGIRGLTYYSLLELETEKIPLPSFFARAEQENVEYIISNYGKDVSYNIPADAPAQIGAYRRIYQDRWSSLYARQYAVH